jgi:hypothetical protein
MNTLRVEGPNQSNERHAYDDDKYVIELMTAALEPIQKYSSKFFTTCTTNGIIQYEGNPNNPNDDDNYSIYTLTINLDCSIFCSKITLTFQDTLLGYHGDNELSKCKVNWQDIVIKESMPLDMKLLYGTVVLEPQSPEEKNFSIILHESNQARWQPRNTLTEADKFRQAALKTVATMQRVMLINRVHCGPLASIIHPKRRDVGPLFNPIPEDLRKRIVHTYINALRADMMDTLQSKERPMPDPF